MRQRCTTGVELPPVAPMLMESLRAVGYTTPAALADLVDNSIAASARSVAIQFAATPYPFVAVIDDGRGMTGPELVSAMRFGSRDPRDSRLPTDLGRFGLGLKTASLSQCRRLTVVSHRDGELATAAWDLDECARRGAWWLEQPEISSVPREVLDLLAKNGRGTAVIWERLDRLVGGASGDPQRILDSAMDDSANHLAMAFHRFLAGEMAGEFDITINGRPLPRLDPFLEGNARGQALHSEEFFIEGQKITVSPFVLPFPSRLKPAELERAGGREGLKTGHGFYVYRGGRLVVPGGWFRIVPSDDLIRLARVRVDVPIELDHLWKVDIRKTVVEPPAELRPHLRRIVGQATVRSRRVYTHKGTLQQSDCVSVWQRHELRDGAAAWKINRDHPAIAALLRAGQSSGDIERTLKLIEDLLPLHDIHVHISNDLPVSDDITLQDDELLMLATRMVDAFRDQPEAIRLLLERLPITDPFSRKPDRARQIAESLRQ